jgi:hypothetical protein
MGVSFYTDESADVKQSTGLKGQINRGST